MSNKSSLSSVISADETTLPEKIISKEELSSKLDFELIEEYRSPTYSEKDREILLKEINRRDKLLVLELINTLNINYSFTNSSFVKMILLEILEIHWIFLSSSSNEP